MVRPVAAAEAVLPALQERCQIRGTKDDSPWSREASGTIALMPMKSSQSLQEHVRRTEIGDEEVGVDV
jgi:hypothetical protein